MYSKATLVSLTALAATSYAQSLPGITSLSQGCQNAATNLISSDFSTCANIIGLVQVVSASGSIVNPINSWLSGSGGVCAQKCSDSAISTARNNIQSGCASDISSGNTLALGLSSVVGNFRDYQSAFCLQAVSNSTYCITNLLGGIQNSTGQPLTIDYLQNVLTGNLIAAADQNLPASAVCTDCSHALTTKIKPILVETTNQTAADQASQAISQRCGAQFTDGQIPSTVKEAAAGASSGSSSGSGSGTGAAAINVAPVFAVIGAIVGGLFVLV